MIGPEVAGHVSSAQHRTTISGYVIYVTVSWLLHPRPERLLEPTTPELVSTQCVGVCGRLGFVVVGRTLAWCSRMTEDVVVCNGDAIIVIEPSIIGRRFFSRTNPGSVCHELMGEHVFGVVIENVIRMLPWSREIAGVVRVPWFGVEYLHVSGLNWSWFQVTWQGFATVTKFWIQLLFHLFAVTTLCSSRTTPDHTQPVLQLRFYKDTTYVDKLPWPAFSPDISPIDTFGTFWIAVPVRVFHHQTPLPKCRKHPGKSGKPSYSRILDVSCIPSEDDSQHLSKPTVATHDIDWNINTKLAFLRSFSILWNICVMFQLPCHQSERQDSWCWLLDFVWLLSIIAYVFAIF